MSNLETFIPATPDHPAFRSVVEYVLTFDDCDPRFAARHCRNYIRRLKTDWGFVRDCQQWGVSLTDLLRLGAWLETKRQQFERQEETIQGGLTQ